MASIGKMVFWAFWLTATVFAPFYLSTNVFGLSTTSGLIVSFVVFAGWMLAVDASM